MLRDDLQSIGETLVDLGTVSQARLMFAQKTRAITNMGNALLRHAKQLAEPEPWTADDPTAPGWYAVETELGLDVLLYWHIDLGWLDMSAEPIADRVKRHGPRIPTEPPAP